MRQDIDPIVAAWAENKDRQVNELVEHQLRQLGLLEDTLPLKPPGYEQMSDIEKKLVDVLYNPTPFDWKKGMYDAMLSEPKYSSRTLRIAHGLKRLFDDSVAPFLRRIAQLLVSPIRRVRKVPQSRQ